MHLLVEDVRSLDAAEIAVDLGQSPADLVFLSLSDSDLAAFADAHRRQDDSGAPTLRLANLNRLKHPYSVDLYLDSVAAGAKLVLVRLLGGLDYWRYGVEELAGLARARGIALAVIPGDYREDPRLDAASTVPIADLRRLWGWFQYGGPGNMASAMGWAAAQATGIGDWSEPTAIGATGRFEPACLGAPRGLEAGGDRPLALVLLYRSIVAAADTAPFPPLAAALDARGLAVETRYVTSLKDPEVLRDLGDWLDTAKPDIILNTTAFSARLDDGRTVLDRAGVVVLQVMLSTASRQAWAESSRGAAAADLAMNVVLPEIDGRLITTAISFKAETPVDPALQYVRQEHRPEPDRIAHVADLAAAWVRLRRRAPADRQLAAVLSNYPARAGRTGYAVGLDTAASIGAIADALADAGYDIGPLPGDLIAALEGRTADEAGPSDAAAATGHAIGVAADAGRGDRLPLAQYVRLFSQLPDLFRSSVLTYHGAPDSDPDLRDDAFCFPVVRSGKLIVALQPDRGTPADRKADSHDPLRPPRHAYVAFYLWLRHVVGIDALIHMGTHGTLEWLPGKAVVLDAASAPEAVLGPVPVIYPFIVNNPGEAAQARRRIGAVTIGHLTPPLIEAGLTGEVGAIEALLDEYAGAQSLDPRRARMLVPAILDKARATGLAAEIGLSPDMEPGEALQRLDARLCDIKDMRIGDGLHVFGRMPEGMALERTAGYLAEAAGATRAAVADLLAGSAAAEMAGLLAALDGRFVPPGPAGAPSRGRLDVLPTGRNLYSVDPRSIPTPTAWEIGRRSAAEVMTRHAQDHGDWPQRIVVDLWGSATMRTGGDDLAQALALMGVKPVWEAATGRVTGYEILNPAKLAYPRVDVTLRISGLFRDVFPGQIALFDSAARAVAALDEDASVNPLAAARRAAGRDGPADDADAARVFGAAPGDYGAGGLTTRLAGDEAVTRADLGTAYLQATSHAYGVGGEAASTGFAARVAGAQAYVHGQDIADVDVLAGGAFADFEGGFAAAAATLGATPALYHLDTTQPQALKVRTLAEEVARVVRGRAANPRWIAGQMRHGHRGAAEIAETAESLLSLAVTAEVVTSPQFDLLFDATLGDEAVRTFLARDNPLAAGAIARVFARAAARGLWVSRRNSTAEILAELLAATPAGEGAE